MGKKEEIKKLNNQIRNCKKCRLWKNRTNAVPGEGNINSKIMFIGEAPGAKEDKLGKPFVGISGRFLDKLFKQNKLKRKDIFITSVVKCRPFKNRNPKPDEVSVCIKNYLFKQINLIKPKIIVLLGNIALKALLNKKKMNEVHGKIFIKNKIKYIPTFHPAAGMRFPKIRKKMIEDFKTLRNSKGISGAQKISKKFSLEIKR